MPVRNAGTPTIIQADLNGTKTAIRLSQDISVTRSAAILAAIQKEITEHRASLDTAQDVYQVTVTVKLAAGTSRVRGTQYTVERILQDTRVHQQSV